MPDADTNGFSTASGGVKGGKSLRSTRLIENCTPSISYDSQVQAASRAFDRQMFQIIDATPQVIIIPNILSLTDSKLVDILAWQFHVDFYDHARDLEFRKRLVQMSIEWHKTKGTVALVQYVLDTYWPRGATIEEWFEYMNPLPPNYPTLGGDTLIGSFAPSDIDLGTNTFTHTAHGLVNGNEVRFFPPLEGSLPAPLQVFQWYFVVGATTNTFQVSTTLGGPALDLTTTGFGTIFKRGSGDWHDRYRFRISVDQTIIEPADEKEVLALIDRYKPVTRWCEGIVRPVVSECNIGWAGAALQFLTLESDAPDWDFNAVDLES